MRESGERFLTCVKLIGMMKGRCEQNIAQSDRTKPLLYKFLCTLHLAPTTYFLGCQISCSTILYER